MDLSNTIGIEYDGHEVTDADKWRAKAAAEAVIAASGFTVSECRAEYRRQWEELDSTDGMTGAAAVWAAAERSADQALTEGWHRPDAAYCWLV